MWPESLKAWMTARPVIEASIEPKSQICLFPAALPSRAQDNDPKHAVLQTKLLEINLITNPQVRVGSLVPSMAIAPGVVQSHCPATPLPSHTTKSAM